MSKPSYEELEQGFRKSLLLLEHALEALGGEVKITLRKKPSEEIITTVDSEVEMMVFLELRTRLNEQRGGS